MMEKSRNIFFLLIEIVLFTNCSVIREKGKYTNNGDKERNNVNNNIQKFFLIFDVFEKLFLRVDFLSSTNIK